MGGALWFNGWGTYGLNGWGTYDKVSCCFVWKYSQKNAGLQQVVVIVDKRLRRMEEGSVCTN